MVSMTSHARARWAAPLGMPIAGLFWSFATLHVNSDRVAAMGVQTGEALFVVSLGGLTQAIAMWAGFAVVAWAIVRGFGGRASLLSLAALISGAALPLWVGAPAAAYWLSGTNGSSTAAGAIALIGLGAFLLFFAHALATDLGWSLARACAAVGTATSFLLSFAFLTL